MSEENRKIYWSKDWMYAWRTLLVIFLLQSALLFLTTGSLNLLDVIGSGSLSKTEALWIALLVGMLKPFGITVAGFLLAKSLHEYRFRNVFVMGALLGGLWGVIVLAQIALQAFNDPLFFGDATGATVQLRLILLVPQHIVREGLTGLLGAGIFALYRKIKKS